MIPDNIKIIKAIKYFDTDIIGSAVLETGVVIHMREDGSALGEDGKTYYTISQDDSDGDCEILGYSCDVDASIDDTAEAKHTYFR